MIKQFIMAGLVPAAFVAANPSWYCESGANVAVAGTYARYGIEQEVNGFTFDTAINFSVSFARVNSVSFSTAIYKNFDRWRIGPEFTTGVTSHNWENAQLYTSYAARSVFDLSPEWSATATVGFHTVPEAWADVYKHMPIWPKYTFGLQRKF